MKALWSFWSKPYVTGRKSFWASEKHHWLSWVLSLETAGKHYPVTCLVTDSHGAEILVDRLGLKFSEVSTEFDALSDEDPQWWALGKLYAYSKQQEPFVHIDNDVYLWKRLPENLEASDVFCQNPEYFSEVGRSWYQPARVDHAFHTTGAALPEEWQWYRRAGIAQRAECCGILGGQRTDFIRRYAKHALKFALQPGNKNAWQLLGDKAHQMTLVEQYLLTACVEFHNAHKTPAVKAVQMDYLFESVKQAYNPERASCLGFTHLISGAKKNETVAANLEERVKQDYPESFYRCVKFSNGS